MAKYTYRFEFQDHTGQWYEAIWLKYETLTFLKGYLWGRRDAPPPRLGMRIVRNDGKVVEESKANDELDIGIIAGWPTPEQYERAAERSIKQAEYIRRMRMHMPSANEGVDVEEVP